MKTEYIVKGDKLVVRTTRTDEKEVDINKLRKRLGSLQERMAAWPGLKTQPDQETLEYYNKHAIGKEAAVVQQEIKAITALLEAVEKKKKP